MANAVDIITWHSLLDIPRQPAWASVLSRNEEVIIWGVTFDQVLGPWLLPYLAPLYCIVGHAFYSRLRKTSKQRLFPWACFAAIIGISIAVIMVKAGDYLFATLSNPNPPYIREGKVRAEGVILHPGFRHRYLRLLGRVRGFCRKQDSLAMVRIPPSSPLPTFCRQELPWFFSGVPCYRLRGLEKWLPKRE